MHPTIGRIVHYQTDERGGLRYCLPAMIVRTQDSSNPNGAVDPLPLASTVDLFVISVNGVSYGEAAVPFDPGTEPAARSWHWPRTIEAPSSADDDKSSENDGAASKNP